MEPGGGRCFGEAVVVANHRLDGRSERECSRKVNGIKGAE
jgi:hypothetical protein